ncbi:hypothetical protein [Palleronia caenipelagi]|uniref:Holin n=1 Tax=Palleronia caenipelagi TaxID=2489174 RepID=A0A547PS53_9RHOB|nr:hypothetical protein [Palleronia caenipelagi]TRD16982.1 hypothetical protein FEV53_13680 [Palleronia caenipelagi]
MHHDPFEQLRQLWVLLPFAVIGFVGGIVNQLYQHARKSQPITIPRLLINGLIAAFVSAMMNDLLPDSMDSYGVAIAGFTGFMAYPILAVLEAQGVDYLKKRFGVK